MQACMWSGNNQSNDFPTMSSHDNIEKNNIEEVSHGSDECIESEVDDDVDYFYETDEDNHASGEEEESSSGSDYEYIDEDTEDNKYSDNGNKDDDNDSNDDKIGSNSGNGENVGNVYNSHYQQQQQHQPWLGDPDAPLLFQHIVNRRWNDASFFVLNSSRTDLANAISYRTPDTMGTSMETSLHAACLRGAPIHLLSALLLADTSAARACDSQKRIPLHHAARFGSSESIGLLLDYNPQGGCVAKDMNGLTPLDVASDMKREPRIISLLKDAYALYDALYQHRWEDVQKLLDQSERYRKHVQNCDFDYVNHICSEGRSCRMCAQLENKKQYSDDGSAKAVNATALHYALFSFAPASIANYLLKICPSSAEKMDCLGRTPLLLLCENWYISSQDKNGDSLVDLLLQHTPLKTIFLLNDNGTNPLFAAIKSRVPYNVVDKIMELSIKSSAKTAMAADTVAENEQQEEVTSFDPSVIGLAQEHTCEQTLLHVACASSDDVIVERLLKFCEEAASVRDYQNATPLHYAIENVKEPWPSTMILPHKPQAGDDEEEGEEDDEYDGDGQDSSTNGASNAGKSTSLMKLASKPQACIKADKIIRKIFNAYKHAASLNNETSGMAPLHLAIKFNRGYKIVRALLDEDPSQLRRVDCYGRTPLLLAAEFATGKVGKMLLDAFPDAVDIKDVGGRTPLLVACRRRLEWMNPRVVASLASADPDEVATADEKLEKREEKAVNERNDWTTQPIHPSSLEDEVIVLPADTEDNVALAEESIKLKSAHAVFFDALLAARPELVATPDNKGETPLLFACSKERYGCQLVKKLLGAYPPSVFVRDGRTGCTPLLMALRNKAEFPLIRVLLRAADKAALFVKEEPRQTSSDLVLIADNSGQTPLHDMIPSGSGQIILELLKVNPNCAKSTCREGNSPAKLACLHGRSAKLLFELVKADPRQLWERDIFGRSLSFYLWKFVNGVLMSIFTRKVAGEYCFPLIPQLPSNDGGNACSDTGDGAGEERENDKTHSVQNLQHEDLHGLSKFVYGIAVFLLKEEYKARNMKDGDKEEGVDWNMVKAAILSDVCPETVVALAVHYHPKQVLLATRSEPSILHHLLERKSAESMGYHNCDYCRATIPNSSIYFHWRVPYALCESCSIAELTIQKRSSYYNRIIPEFNGITSFLLVKEIIRQVPVAASIPDTIRGRLPLNTAIGAGVSWDFLVQHLFNSAPEALGSRDQVMHMFPFMLAAIGDSGNIDENDDILLTNNSGSKTPANPNKKIKHSGFSGIITQMMKPCSGSHSSVKSHPEKEEQSDKSRLGKMSTVFELLVQNPTAVNGGIHM